MVFSHRFAGQNASGVQPRNYNVTVVGTSLMSLSLFLI